MEAEYLIPPSYPASRAAAILVHPHFARHPSEAPGVDTIEAIVDAAFWASLRREEGYVPRISMAFAAPDEVKRPLRIERPPADTGDPDARVARSASSGNPRRLTRTGQPGSEDTRKLPAPVSCWSAHTGLLVIKHSRSENPANSSMSR